MKSFVQFNLRLSLDLHHALKNLADHDDRSLHNMIIRILTQYALVSRIGQSPSQETKGFENE